MVSDVCGSKGVKLIGGLSEVIKGILAVFIVKPLESIEEIHYKEYASTRRYFFVATSSRFLIYDDLTTKNQASKTERQK